jgi:hypothetical protein
MGVGGQPPGRFTAGNDPVSIVQELGRPHGRSGRVLKISSPPGFDPLTVQLVASRYTDWAIPAHNNNNGNTKIR